MQYQAKPVGSTFFGVDSSLFKDLELEINNKERTAMIVYVRVAEEHKGSFRKLLTAIEHSQYLPMVFCPVRRTRGIIARMGYAPSETDPDIWVKGREASFEEIAYGVRNDNFRNCADSVFE